MENKNIFLGKLQKHVFVKSDGDCESESDGEPVIKEMVLTKKNTKYFFLLIYIMFNKTQYKLLIYEYMDKYNITYTNANN